MAIWVGLFVGAGLAAQAQNRGPAGPLPVSVAEAKRVELTDRIEALGTLRANESVEVMATESERVVELGFEDGDRVTQGQMLVRLEAYEEEALCNEAVSTANEARRQYDRVAQLAQRGAASVAQLDEARRNYETAHARKVALESRLARLTITAPFAGVVGLRNISLGALVRPGDLITTLDDDSKMLLDFSVPSNFLPALQPGTPLEATAPGFVGKKFQGTIRSVASRIDPVTRTVQVRAELPNPERLLKPGMLMKVELLGRPRLACVVPEGALLPQGRGNAVFVIVDSADASRAERREVQTGARRQGWVEILQGVEAGERVVVDGGFRLSPGAVVKVNDRPGKAVESVPAS